MGGIFENDKRTIVMDIIKGLKHLLVHVYNVMQQQKPYYPNVHKTAHLASDAQVVSPQYLYMEEETSIPRGATIMNGPGGRFIMKKWSFSSIDLLVICGNHMPVVGMPLIKVTDEIKKQLDTKHEYSKDVIVDEDVWIGARVTLLPGVQIGRGAIIATGAVVSHSVPPYSIYGGVPAKHIKWKWSIEEILEHESKVYPEEKRFTRQDLEVARNK